MIWRRSLWEVLWRCCWSRFRVRVLCVGACMKVSRLLTKTVRDPCMKTSEVIFFFFLCRVICKVAAASAVVFSLTCYCSIRRSASIQCMDYYPHAIGCFLRFFLETYFWACTLLMFFCFRGLYPIPWSSQMHLQTRWCYDLASSPFMSRSVQDSFLPSAVANPQKKTCVA